MSIRFIFFGTPDFAVPSLSLLSSTNQCLAVVTATDKPAGRGHNMQISPIKKYALEHNLKIYQPKNLKSQKFIESLKILNADIFIVVAFRMLPKEIWSLPPLGTINLHASLLPDYRGAAPIQHAILNGETKTGVTSFFIRESIDTGDIILQQEISIHESDDAGSLHDKMMEEGARLLVKTVDHIQHPEFKAIPQSNSSSLIAPKIFPENTIINWDNKCKNVYNFIRAFCPYPGAKTTYNGEVFKIYKTSIESSDNKLNPGSWIFDFTENTLKISCIDGYLKILEIQPPSKRKMNTKDYINGLKNK